MQLTGMCLSVIVVSGVGFPWEGRGVVRVVEQSSKGTEYSGATEIFQILKDPQYTGISIYDNSSNKLITKPVLYIY